MLVRGSSSLHQSSPFSFSGCRSVIACAGATTSPPTTTMPPHPDDDDDPDTKNQKDNRPLLHGSVSKKTKRSRNKARDFVRPASKNQSLPDVSLLSTRRAAGADSTTSTTTSSRLPPGVRPGSSAASSALLQQQRSREEEAILHHHSGRNKGVRPTITPAPPQEEERPPAESRERSRRLPAGVVVGGAYQRDDDFYYHAEEELLLRRRIHQQLLQQQPDQMGAFLPRSNINNNLYYERSAMTSTTTSSGGGTRRDENRGAGGDDSTAARAGRDSTWDTRRAVLEEQEAIKQEEAGQIRDRAEIQHRDDLRWRQHEEQVLLLLEERRRMMNAENVLLRSRVAASGAPAFDPSSATAAAVSSRFLGLHHGGLGGGMIGPNGPATTLFFPNHHNAAHIPYAEFLSTRLMPRALTSNADLFASSIQSARLAAEVEYLRAAARIAAERAAGGPASSSSLMALPPPSGALAAGVDGLRARLAFAPRTLNDGGVPEPMPPAGAHNWGRGGLPTTKSLQQKEDVEQQYYDCEAAAARVADQHPPPQELSSLRLPPSSLLSHKWKADVDRLLERYSSGGTKEAPFVLKLHAILANDACQPFISWLPDGKSWRIVNSVEFSKEVIPRHFRHAKYSSFMRQVNGWGFRRTIIPGDSTNSAYENERFHREEPEQCLKMVRIGATKNAGGEIVAPQKSSSYKDKMIPLLNNSMPTSTSKKRKSSSTEGQKNKKDSEAEERSEGKKQAPAADKSAHGTTYSGHECDHEEEEEEGANNQRNNKMVRMSIKKRRKEENKEGSDEYDDDHRHAASGKGRSKNGEEDCAGYDDSDDDSSDNHGADDHHGGGSDSSSQSSNEEMQMPVSKKMHRSDSSEQ